MKLAGGLICGEFSERNIVEDSISTGVNRDSAERSLHWTRQAQLAGLVKKQQQAFPGTIALSLVPQPAPPADAHHLPISDSTNGLFHPESDLDGIDASRVGGHPLHRKHGAIKYVTRTPAQPKQTGNRRGRNPGTYLLANHGWKKLHCRKQ
jgi:hypothetical protein